MSVSLLHVEEKGENVFVGHSHVTEALDNVLLVIRQYSKVVNEELLRLDPVCAVPHLGAVRHALRDVRRHSFWYTRCVCHVYDLGVISF